MNGVTSRMTDCPTSPGINAGPNTAGGGKGRKLPLCRQSVHLCITTRAPPWAAEYSCGTGDRPNGANGSPGERVGRVGPMENIVTSALPQGDALSLGERLGLRPAWPSILAGAKPAPKNIRRFAGNHRRFTAHSPCAESSAGGVLARISHQM